MSPSEAANWWKALAVIWGVMLFYTFALTIAGTEKGQTEGPVFMAWTTGGMTALYVLILSWRAIYLAGQRKSRR